MSLCRLRLRELLAVRFMLMWVPLPPMKIAERL